MTPVSHAMAYRTVGRRRLMPRVGLCCHTSCCGDSHRAVGTQVGLCRQAGMMLHPGAGLAGEDGCAVVHGQRGRAQRTQIELWRHGSSTGGRQAGMLLHPGAGAAGEDMPCGTTCMQRRNANTQRLPPGCLDCVAIGPPARASRQHHLVWSFGRLVCQRSGSRRGSRIRPGAAPVVRAPGASPRSRGRARRRGRQPRRPCSARARRSGRTGS